MPEWYSRRARPRQRTSVISEGVDQLALAHGRPAFDPDLGGPLLELLLRPVLVVLCFPPLLPVSLRLPALAMRAAFSLLAPSRRRASYCSSSLIDDPWFFAMACPFVADTFLSPTLGNAKRGSAKREGPDGADERQAKGTRATAFTRCA